MVDTQALLAELCFVWASVDGQSSAAIRTHILVQTDLYLFL